MYVRDDGGKLLKNWGNRSQGFRELGLKRSCVTNASWLFNHLAYVLHWFQPF